MQANMVKVYGPPGLAGGSIIFIIFVYLFGFSAEKTLIPIEVHFAMEMDITGGPSMHVWANTPLLTRIQVEVFNVSKKEDGSWVMDQDMMQLIPSDDETSYGGAFSRFSLTLIGESAKPVVDMTMPMIPMIFTREENVGKIMTFILWFGAFVLSNWTTFKWALIASSLVLLGMGVAVVAMSKKKEKETIVSPIIPPEK